MKARLAAAGLNHDPAAPAQSPLAAGDADPAQSRLAAGDGVLASSREADARSRAGERRYRQRQMLRPLGWAFIAVVLIAGLNSHPSPGLTGIRLAILAAIAGYVVAAAVGLTPGWAERGLAAQAAVISLAGAGGVALAGLQPHGAAGLAASLGVWIAAVRLPARPAAAAGGAITVALGTTIALTQRPAAPSVIAAVLLCLLLGVTGRFIRRGRESQDQTELLLAQLQDAREAEAAAVALAERSRIAGELHDVLAHALSGLAIQLQGARKLAEAEPVSQGLRAAIGRSAELAREGLADARRAVGALRGDRLPTVGQLGGLIEDFRRDTGTSVSLLIEGTPRQLSAEANLALYRGAQEALTNIVRYAPGAIATVTVRYAPDRTVLRVENSQPPGDGAQTGAAPGGSVLASAGGGHGLTAMRERATRAGGTAKAGPAPGGWLVEMEIPA
jgi:signal transduction histidine kinase